VPVAPRYYYTLNNHQVVGLLPKSGNFSSHIYKRNKSPFLNEYKGLLSKNFLRDLAGDKFATVQPTQKNVDKTILSWDKYGKEDATYSSKLQSFVAFATDFYKTEYGNLYKDSIASEDEIMASYDLTKSPGFPGTQFGLRSKKNYFEHKISKEMEAYRHILPVIYNGVPKVEIKDMADILACKVRIFCVSPTHYLHYQKKFTVRLSERFKLYKWSAYGINLYSGGADSICANLLTKHARVCYDVSGWDKFIPLIPLIYQTHKELLIQFGDYQDYKSDFNWVAQNLTEMLIRLPNGEVLKKVLGNPSGSGSTTLDNIRMHIVLLVTLLAKAFFDKYDSYPSFQLITTQIAYIFGDDNIAGIDEEFSKFIDRAWLTEHMKLFNLELKFLHINTSTFGDHRDFLDDDTQEPLSFLGATFVKRRGIFIPKYDPVRLAHSCYFDLKKLELVGYLSKIMTLTIMSYGSSHFQNFMVFFKDYCRIPEVACSKDPAIVSIRHISALINEDYVHEFYAGFEANDNKIIEFFDKDQLIFFTQFDPDTVLQASEAEALNQVMSNNKGVLNKLIENKILSVHSVSALKVAMDGWHDTTISDFRGIPDKHVGQLFTFDDVAEVEISRTTSPVALPVGPWQCRIGAFPFGNIIPTSSGTLTGSAIESNLASFGMLGNVQINYATNGADFAPTGVAGFSNDVQFLSMSSAFLTSKLKLCGLAIEVVNTTPQLTVGGLVTACNVPQPSSKSTFQCTIIDSANPTATPANVGMRLVNSFPKNLKEMAKFSPFQGEAKQGCYINARMQFQDETPECMPICPVVLDTDITSPVYPNYMTPNSIEYGRIFASPTLPTAPRSFRSAVNWFDMDSPVIMLTGLSNETTLMVRVRWFGQIVPDEDNNIFLRAAHPAPVYDPNFFEIYSRAMELCPKACYFTENPSGEWWKSMVASIAKAAAPLLGMIPHPLGKAASVAAAGLGTIMDDQGAQSKRKRKAKNKAGFYGPDTKKTAEGKFKNAQGQKVKKRDVRRNRIPNAPPA